MTATAGRRPRGAAARHRAHRTSPAWSSPVLLLLALLFSLAILAVLVGSQLVKGVPVFAERGTDFLTSPPVEQPGQGRRRPGHHRDGAAGVDRGASSPSRSGS